MANQIVLNYLKNYSGKYPPAQLRQKIISSGYSENDVDEAIAILGLNEQAKSVSSTNFGISTPHKGVKWMKIAGVVGFVFLVFSLVSIVISFFAASLLTNLTSLTLIVVISGILSVVMFVLFILYYYGFVKMGKYTESKLLRFSAMSIIISAFAIIVLVIVSIVFLYSFISSAFSPSSIALFNPVSSPISGNAVAATSSAATSGLGTLGWILFLVFLLLMLFILVVNILFFVSLILVGKKVKFTKIAGFLGLILIAVSIVSFIFIASNPLIMISMLVSSAARVGYIVFQVILYILGLAVLLLESLALFDASKKFESA